MVWYAIKRVLLAAVTVFLVAAITFFAMHFIPGGPFDTEKAIDPAAKAALITRGNAELARLGVAMGCQAATFAGLSGMGDLIVTCTSMHSRNLHAGMLLGRGMDVEEAKKEVGQVVEGINALPAARKLARQYKVEMPIVEAVGRILDGKLTAKAAVAALMGRDLKRE